MGISSEVWRYSFPIIIISSEEKGISSEVIPISSEIMGINSPFEILLEKHEK
nr:MAG TPA: hypothetical protein [Caudoviricetes sp.]